MTLQSTVPAASPEQKNTTANGSAAPAIPASDNGHGEAAHPARLPKNRRASRLGRWLTVLAMVAFVGAAGGAYFIWFRGPTVRTDLVTIKVDYKDLQLKVVERGALEAKENHDIKCEVKTGSRGAPKIKWVVDNGTLVKKDDLLVDIDDSYLQEQAQAKKIELDKAEADKIAAEEIYPVKKVAIGLAEQNLEKWVKGDFPQQLHDLEGQIQIAESTLLQQRDRASWASRMVKKGYMTVSQEESERANERGDELNLLKLQEQRNVLTKYTDPVQRQSLQNAIKQAKVDERTAYSDMESKRAIFRQQADLYKDLMEQIGQCKVKAPNSGIVVYTVPEQTMRGSGSNQSIIAQGEPVQFGQKMLSIPDLSHMLVNLRIHEAFINHMKDSLPATIRVDAVPGKVLKGHVKSVAQVASPQDWMSPDVKVYQSYVQIDEPVEQLKLKPGLSSVCTIFTDSKVEHVLAIPIQAVVSPQERGGKNRCFVLTPTGPEARDVELGLSDERSVEIKSGLKEGDDVILNPRALLSDKEKRSVKEDEKMPQGGGKQGGRGGDGGRGGEGGMRGGERSGRGFSAGDAPSGDRK
jgi:multidrug efflux pump subunit AcrA (membrane-fusion protein)